jgi:predicted Holliday junction resolvase-like endonuclease
MRRLIQSLKSRSLVAECPLCGKEFALSDALLFDGTAPFPEAAEQRRREYEDAFKLRIADFGLRKARADTGVARTTTAVRIGQMIEHIVPALKDFKLRPADCRPLFDPIDLLAFNGVSESKVSSLTFMEIKTGDARLNANQRRVKAAIGDKRVFYEEV